MEFNASDIISTLTGSVLFVDASEYINPVVDKVFNTFSSAPLITAILTLASFLDMLSSGNVGQLFYRFFRAVILISLAIFFLKWSLFTGFHLADSVVSDSNYFFKGDKALLKITKDEIVKKSKEGREKFSVNEKDSDNPSGSVMSFLFSTATSSVATFVARYTIFLMFGLIGCAYTFFFYYTLCTSCVPIFLSVLKIREGGWSSLFSDCLWFLFTPFTIVIITNIIAALFKRDAVSGVNWSSVVMGVCALIMLAFSFRYSRKLVEGGGIADTASRVSDGLMYTGSMFAMRHLSRLGKISSSIVGGKLGSLGNRAMDGFHGFRQGLGERAMAIRSHYPKSVGRSLNPLAPNDGREGSGIFKEVGQALGLTKTQGMTPRDRRLLLADSLLNPADNLNRFMKERKVAKMAIGTSGRGRAVSPSVLAFGEKGVNAGFLKALQSSAALHVPSGSTLASDDGLKMKDFKKKLNDSVYIHSPQRWVHLDSAQRQKIRSEYGISDAIPKAGLAYPSAKLGIAPMSIKEAQKTLDVALKIQKEKNDIRTLKINI